MSGHSGRYKGSISNRSAKSRMYNLCKPYARTCGKANQVPVCKGGDTLKFESMNAKMMSNYDKNKDEFILDCSLNVKGNKTVTGNVIYKSDVTVEGDVTIDGVLNAQTALIQDLSAVNITDVSDNVLTLGNHESVTNKHMRGIFMSHLDTSGITYTDNYSFMGFDPCGNDCVGVVNDSHGQFVFLTDASFNSQATDTSCNIPFGQAGRVLVGTLDISGSARYGNGSGNSGAPTQNVTGQENSSMHLVGRTIIAQDASGGPVVSAQLDISGGICVVGNSIITDLSGAYVDVSGRKIDISGDDVSITGSSGSSLHLKGPKISIGQAGGTVDLSGNVDASGTITAGTLTDGTATLTGGALSDATNINGTGNLNMGGNLTIGGISNLGSINIVNIDASGVVSIPNPATSATNSNNSALKVVGGAHIGGTCHVGGEVVVSGGALGMNGGSISDVNGLTASGQINCNGITIGNSGISLDGDSSISGLDLSSNTIVTGDRYCGKIDISGSIDAGITSNFTFQNNKINTTSIILTNLDSGTSGSAVLQSLQMTPIYNVSGAGSVSLGISNPTVSTIPIPLSAGVKVHFLIINPTS